MLLLEQWGAGRKAEAMVKGHATTQKREFAPCPACGKDLSIRYTSKDKPYLNCEHCGAQVFINRDEGIRHFLGTSGPKGKRSQTDRPAASELVGEDRITCEECSEQAGTPVRYSRQVLKPYTDFWTGEKCFECPEGHAVELSRG